MGRTTRYIPFWARHKSKFDLTQKGINPNYPDNYVNEIRWRRGLDKHKATSLIRTSPPPAHIWSEYYSGKARRFFKRHYHSKVRQTASRLLKAQAVDNAWDLTDK